MRSLHLVVLILAVLFAAVPAPAAEFPLQDGDIWVMAGDSITAQHLHSNYFEAFCFARYPNLKFAFRNSGVGGHTIPSTLDRYGYDIDAWKPTVVSVELGMNDQGRFTTEQYIANMTTMVERIMSSKARPIMFTASPINSGDTMAKLGGNTRLNDYAVALKEFSAKRNLPFADQFHLLLDVWGKNKPRERLADAMFGIRAFAADKSLAGVEHLQQFLAEQDRQVPPPVSMRGDPVHPGPTGQLMMAAALLQDLGAQPFVSSAALDATGKVLEAKGCTIDKAQAADGGLSFDRQETVTHFPIPDDAAAVMVIDPTIEALSQLTLQVKGLDGRYSIKINGAALPTAVTSEALEKGVNLTRLAHYRPATPEGSPAVNGLVAQSRAILNAVAMKEGLVSSWRGLSQRASGANAPAELKMQLEQMTKQVQAADEVIRKAAAPQKFHYEIVPVPGT